MARAFAMRPCDVCQASFRPLGPKSRYCTPICAVRARVVRGLAADVCWPFIGARIAAGYGVVRHGGVNHYAHRVVLEAETGALGPLMALHRCDNPRCCNPAHLFRGDNAANQADCHAKGRRLHTNYATGDRHGRRKMRTPAHAV